jgi:hypothetical protein
MSTCDHCGAADQLGRFCASCGTPLIGPSIDLRKAAVPGPAEPTVVTGPAADARWAATASYPLPAPTAPQVLPPASPPRRGPGVAVLVVLVVAALLVAGVGAWFVIRPTGGQQAIAVLPATTSAATSVASSPAGGPAKPAPIGPPGSKADPASSAAPPIPTVTSTAVVTATVALDPMGGPRVDIACGSGYIVQVASELDQAAFAARVAALRSAGTLPADAKWTETSTSCAIFTTQANVLVLYAGPYPSVQAACPARLASPADAFVKSTDPATVGTFRSCLCPAAAGDLPAISTVGQQGVWIGELQRVLGGGLDYTVGAINADPAVGDPGRWGTYTAETAAAVRRFQADHGLAATGQVDAATWSALQVAWCGQE